MPFTPYHFFLAFFSTAVLHLISQFRDFDIHPFHWFSLYFGSISPDIQGVYSVFVDNTVKLHGFSHTIVGVLAYSLIWYALLFAAYRYLGSLRSYITPDIKSSSLILFLSGLFFHILPDMLIYLDMMIYLPLSDISYGGTFSYQQVAGTLIGFGIVSISLVIISIIIQLTKQPREKPVNSDS